MNELKKELGLVKGVILLTTSLLGTGVFALPELAALAAGSISLWAWPLLIILIFPIAIVFAVLGRHFPHAGGIAHFVGMAFGPRLQRVISWLFLSVIPVSFPAALHIAVGFGQALFGWRNEQLLFGELGTIGLLWFMGSRGASSSANLQAIIGWISHRAYCRHSVEKRVQTHRYHLSSRKRNHFFPAVYRSGDHVLGICGH
nr:transporter [Salmonella sp. NCTC 7297]